MWLTSSWVAWLLNFYGNCMVFYQTPWTRYGIPWNSIGTSGNPMAFHGTLRYSMKLHGPPRKLHGISWHSMELHEYILHGYSMEVPWNSMDFHRFPWISMEFMRYFTRNTTNTIYLMTGNRINLENIMLLITIFDDHIKVFVVFTGYLITRNS